MCLSKLNNKENATPQKDPRPSAKEFKRTLDALTESNAENRELNYLVSQLRGDVT